MGLRWWPSSRGGLSVPLQLSPSAHGLISGPCSESSPEEQNHEGQEQPEQGSGEEEEQEILHRKGQPDDHNHGHEASAPHDGEEDRPGLEFHGVSYH